MPMKMYVNSLPNNYLMSSQHQQELKGRPSDEQVLESECGVCFVPYAKVAPRRIDEGLEILFCSRCFIHVHKCCYDFAPNLTVLSDRISDFLCDRCAGPPIAPAADHCLVCLGEQGAMKRLGDELIHVYCGLMHNDIEAVSYYPSITFKKSPHYDESALTCELCKRKNAHEQCAEESCRRKVHVYCAKTNYVNLSKESEDELRTWNHKISTGNHGNFDLSDEVIPYELLSEEVEVSLREVEQLGLDLSAKEEFKRRVHKGYMEEIRARRKTTKKLRRGGFSFVLCPQHESPTYCSCFGKTDGDDMVLCECCFQWYHHKCLKYPPTNDSYVCQYCRTFYDFKRRAVEEVRGGRAEVEVGRVQLPLKVSVMDCLWVLRVLDNRIRGGQAAKMLKELYKYPLKSSCMDLLIRHQNRNKLTALVEECLGQFLRSEELRLALRPRVVLAADTEGRAQVVVANVEYNRLVRKGVELVVGLLGEGGQGFTGVLRELDFKERALSDSYEQIIELSKVEQPYQEVSILRQKAQAYDFLEIIRKINERTPVSHQELTASIQKAKALPDLPHYLTSQLQNKYNTVQPILTKITEAIAIAPQNTYQVSQLVEELQAENVLPPQEYLQLVAEKKLVQGLYLYLIKQEGKQLQEGLTVAQQLQELLEAQPLRPSQELVDILAAYRSNDRPPLWPTLTALLTRYQGAAVDFEIREMAKRKFSKQEKFLSVVERAADVDLASISEEARTILQSWRELKGQFDTLMGLQLDSLCQYDELAKGAKLGNAVVEGLESFPIRLEEEGAKAIVQQAKTRKEELEQLRTLYTESQLQKNPLTLTKLLPSLPKANPLVRQWTALKKEQATLQGKFSTLLGRIGERLEYFRTQKKQNRKEQIKEISEKPSLTEVTELIQTLKHSNVEMGKEVRELTRLLNNSLEVASKVRKYIEEKGDCGQCTTLEELSIRRKEIEQQRKRVLFVAELSLKGELAELYHLEICNRMRTSLLSPGLELEKINMQLKFAEEEGLMHTETYLALKEKYDTKSQKSKEVTLLKNTQSALAAEAARDSSPALSSLLALRKQLHTPELPEVRTKNTYLDQLADRNRQLREKVSQALHGVPTKWELAEARALLLDVLKNPYSQPEFVRLATEVGKACEVQRKWRESGRVSAQNPLFLEYDLLTFYIEEMETVKRQIRNNEEELGRLEYFLQSFSEGHRDQLEQVIERIETSTAIRETDLCRQAELKYLRFWTRLLPVCRNAKRSVPFEKLRRLALDAYNLLQRSLRAGQDNDGLKTIIYELEDILILVKNHLKCYPSRLSNALLAEGFVDLQELYLENDDEETDLADSVPLLRPFSDLPKFRTRNLQRLELRKEDFSLKRSRDKLEELQPQRPSMREMSRSPSSEDGPVGVSEGQRRKIKEIFLKNMRKNPQLRRYGQCENEVKMIQNQIFGEWHNDVVKYFQMSQQFQKLFIKLVHCPNISSKLIKKKFEFKFIQILVSNLHKIEELEGLMVNKLKEIQTEKTITKITESVTEKVPDKEEALIDSIATGNVDQSLKQDLKKEMKIIKESTKHRTGRKKHKHRSRSRSPDAKFSSDSEKELPSYIQNEYNKEEKTLEKKQDPIPRIPEASPLRYDPEEEDQAAEIVFPKGSLLKLKTCELQVQTRKRGRAEFGAEVMTEQEHRRILTDLFDPGFTRLAIKKDKNEVEIIQYIAKSKKKYKYLVCWFEAVRPEDNEILLEVAQEANQKRKIFGWQNEHVKIHIMSLRQLVQVGRFAAPARVSSANAANVLANERLLMVLQYPEKTYEVRDTYKPFENIERRTEEFATFVPAPIEQPLPAFDLYPKYTMPTIEPLNKVPTYEEPKMVYEGGWGNEGVSVPPPQMQPIPQPPIQPPLPISIPQQQMPSNNLPYKINQIRMHFGIKSFSPILTDEEEGDNNGDLASDLLNSLGDYKMLSQPQPPIQREKAPPIQQPPQQQQQQYQGYYGYGYQPQPQPQAQRPMQPDNRWMDYRNMGQQMGQPQGGQVYNPLNPMAGKYSAPPQPQMGQIPPNQMGQMQPSNQMYKNPIVDQQRRPQMGQYYRSPSDGYDRRYQGGYQQ